mmetsp:Transcript_11400/g.16885  ORF Transcript_11400/g.16885 Transcript_11400/m.16885 type:complete len:131 (+) Transcript_11400:4496-4888(+)
MKRFQEHAKTRENEKVARRNMTVLENDSGDLIPFYKIIENTPPDRQTEGGRALTYSLVQMEGFPKNKAELQKMDGIEVLNICQQMELILPNFAFHRNGSLRDRYIRDIQDQLFFIMTCEHSAWRISLEQN